MTVLRSKYFLSLYNELEVSLGTIGFYLDSELQRANNLNVWLLKPYLIMCKAGLIHNPFCLSHLFNCMTFANKTFKRSSKSTEHQISENKNLSNVECVYISCLLV